MKTSTYKYGNYLFDEFNPVQSDVMDYLEDDCNLVIAAKTSAGKTICGEIIAGKALKEGQTVVYLSPLKALAEEKSADWIDEEHPWEEYKKIVLTGDYRLTDRRQQELLDADIIIATYEMMSVRCRRFSVENNSWLKNIGVLIVDEAHFLGSENRGDHLENAILNFTKVNPEARLVLLSATLKNCDEIAEWCTDLNGKGTTTILSDYRPCDLKIHFSVYRSTYNYMQNEEAKLDVLSEIMHAHQEDQWLIFVHSKAAGRMALRMIENTFGRRAAFHNADLTLDQRREVEKNFKSGVIRYLVATSTLAYGLNLPARRVAIFGLQRGINYVDPLDVIQECGRAGRPKYDDQGDAYVIVAIKDRFRWEQDITKGVKVMSQLALKLGFHLIGEISERRVTTPQEGRHWYNKTFAAHQSGNATMTAVEPLMDQYRRVGLIRKQGWATNIDSPEEIKYEATQLGRIASIHYFDPFDVVDWKDNFLALVDRDMLQDDVSIAWAIANIGSLRTGFIPKSMRQLTNEMLGALKSRDLMMKNQGGTAQATVIYHQIQGHDDTLKPFIAHRIGIQTDSERMTSCFRAIDTRVLHRTGVDEYWEDLKARLYYGVTWEPARLCKIPGVGKKWSKVLADAGVTRDNLTERMADMKEILPLVIFTKVKQYASDSQHGPVREGWQAHKHRYQGDRRSSRN